MDFRIQKFNNTLKKIIGESISNLDELASEVSMISIMSVDTSKDFSFSKVFVSIYNPSNEYIDQIIENLNDKAFYFQKIIRLFSHSPFNVAPHTWKLLRDWIFII